MFLQGSYGNDTNVYGDSDVDIVLQHTGAFYHDTSRLTPKDLEAFKSIYPTDAAYGYLKFKADAEAWIARLYNEIQVGKKAVFVPGNNNRRNADILICQDFRRYNSTYDSYREGVAFFSGGKRIENFPKKHSANLTAKHQATNSNFKRMVRVFKNMRNSMIEKKMLADGIAPSYFIEGTRRALVVAMREALEKSDAAHQVDKIFEVESMICKPLHYVPGLDAAMTVIEDGLDLGKKWLERDRSSNEWFLLSAKMADISLKDYLKRTGNL